MKYERNFHLLNGKFRELFIPTLLAAVAGNFATLGDAFVISTFLGSTNLSVVQSISPLTQFVNMLYWIIGFGGTILCTTARANFDKKQANQIFSLSMITIILSSVIITLLGVLFPDSFMQILCNSSQLRPLVYEYFRIYIFCIPFMCSTVVLAYFIRTDDFVQLQFRALLLINCLNVILDIFFIEFLKYGIGGAALGTTLSFFIGTVYISTYFMSNRRTLKLIKIDVKNSFKNLVDICKTGFSSSSIALYQALKLVVINSLLLGVVGHVGLVAFNMCSQSVFIVSIFIFGTTQSILPIVAIYYEEDDHNGVAYVAKISLKIVMVFGILFTVLFGVFPESLLFLFSVNNPADIPTVITAVRIFSLCFLGYAVTFLYIFYAQSVQYTRLANIITFLNGLAFPIIFAYIFHISGRKMEYGLHS